MYEFYAVRRCGADFQCFHSHICMVEIRTLSMIQTARLNLIPADLALMEAVLAGNATLSRVLGVNVPRKWTENADAFPFFFELIKKDPALERWGAHLIIHRTENLLIGSGGFKGGPTPEGAVEIGYEIKKSHRERGLATEVARGLVDFAFAEPTVKVVLAHTLPQENPSNVLLKKLGFLFDGDVIDPEEGPLWCWRLGR